MRSLCAGQGKGSILRWCGMAIAAAMAETASSSSMMWSVHVVQDLPPLRRCLPVEPACRSGRRQLVTRAPGRHRGNYTPARHGSGRGSLHSSSCVLQWSDEDQGARGDSTLSLPVVRLSHRSAAPRASTPVLRRGRVLPRRPADRGPSARAAAPVLLGAASQAHMPCWAQRCLVGQRSGR